MHEYLCIQMNKHTAAPAPMRREKILKVIRNGAVLSQEDLKARLKRDGIEVTQATLSRDIHELCLLKGPSGYMASETANTSLQHTGEGGRLHKVLRESVISIETAGNLVVIKTPPAEAQTLARLIDRARVEGSVGNIAGDDTIFLAAKTSTGASALKKTLLFRSGLRDNAKKSRS